ncbi:MAG TPA: AAA family ATPase [Flavitalea sp.]|nr:AAA family ATPase [Flavitalea sp.]
MQNLQLRKATRQRAKIRMGFSAVSGGGKTYSALFVAFGLSGDWEKIAVIDTENMSADLYSDLGPYQVLTLGGPYTPERYVEAIKTCEAAGMDVIIIDSITHEWDGRGGILDIHSNMTGNSFTNWSTLTPRHQAFIDAILKSTCHILTTVRRKQDYEMSKDNNGKNTVTKLGLKEVTREGFEYELTLNLELDVKHNATVSKDRTGLFAGKPSFIPTVETGKLIRLWCDSGSEPIVAPDPREELTVTHAAWPAVVQAIQNGYTLAQVEKKYRVTNGSKVALEELIATKNQPKPQDNHIQTPAAATNEPF